MAGGYLIHTWLCVKYCEPQKHSHNIIGASAGCWFQQPEEVLTGSILYVHQLGCKYGGDVWLYCGSCPPQFTIRVQTSKYPFIHSEVLKIMTLKVMILNS